MLRQTRNADDSHKISRDVEPQLAETFFVTKLPDAIAKGARFESRRSWQDAHFRAIPVQMSFTDDERF